MTLINNNEDKFGNPSLVDASKCLDNSREFSIDSLIKIEYNKKTKFDASNLRNHPFTDSIANNENSRRKLFSVSFQSTNNPFNSLSKIINIKNILLTRLVKVIADKFRRISQIVAAILKITV